MPTIKGNREPPDKGKQTMSNMQIILSVFLASIFPTLTALVGILLNRKDAQELRGEMSDVRERLARMETKVGMAS
jgi:hypothetical protein